MESHIQRTLVIIKPDGVQRTLVGEIISRFERVGLKLVAMKMLQADTATVGKHYQSDPNWKRNIGEKIIKGMKEEGKEIGSKTPEDFGEKVLQQLTKFMTAGPVVVMVLEGAYAIPLTRKLVGSTEPLSSDVGTIRGDFVLDSYKMADTANRAIRNIIHASSSEEDAEKEINLWFMSAEIMSYITAHEHILYDVNFDNVNE